MLYVMLRCYVMLSHFVLSCLVSGLVLSYFLPLLLPVFLSITPPASLHLSLPPFCLVFLFLFPSPLHCLSSFLLRIKNRSKQPNISVPHPVFLTRFSRLDREIESVGPRQTRRPSINRQRQKERQTNRKTDRQIDNALSRTG
jgi:hypothetical protein